MHMIDISGKKVMKREAVAQGKLFLKKETIEKIKKNEIKKGNPFETAQIASINAAKQTSLLIPMCHQILLGTISADFKINEDHIVAKITVTAPARTGVEMEALVGVSIALITIWDMVKYLEKDDKGQYPFTRITDVEVLKKLKCAMKTRD